MGQQIIQVPDGTYAIWSSIVDDWVFYDLKTWDQVIEVVVDEARTLAEESARRNLDRIKRAMDEGGKPYHQFTMTFEEAQARRKSHHGTDEWPPPDGEEWEPEQAGVQS